MELVNTDANFGKYVGKLVKTKEKLGKRWRTDGKLTKTDENWGNRRITMKNSGRVMITEENMPKPRRKLAKNRGKLEKTGAKLMKTGRNFPRTEENWRKRTTAYENW